MDYPRSHLRCNCAGPPLSTYLVSTEAVRNSMVLVWDSNLWGAFSSSLPVKSELPGPFYRGADFKVEKLLILHG
jgi:hypothetical protein